MSVRILIADEIDLIYEITAGGEIQPEGLQWGDADHTPKLRQGLDGGV
ncbi:MAG: hypothetical protein GY761_18545 [Hyphomicrobiales bacterium]|nr:hypothetical protein [Hyphomicrobiales bacterium]